ncbi:MAG: GT4 family glycosyltransferase PelF [Granulosicoccus sp.]
MNTSPRYNPLAHADVCLLLEGTFPYVRGGVSTWVRQLIEGMPHLSFSIVYLGADSEANSEPVYSLPDNVVHLETHFLLDPLSAKPAVPLTKKLAQGLTRMLGSEKSACPDSTRFEQSDCLHARLHEEQGKLDSSIGGGFARLLCGDNPITADELETHGAAWDSIRAQYAKAPEGLDFNHYFWSVRSMHTPLFKLSDIALRPPIADVYHSVSTGYAGYLGALIKQRLNVPFIISEHGIYTKERELDLAQVDWIPEGYDPFKVGLNDNMSYLRGLWIRFFRSLGRMAYASANEVFTLYEGNRQRQVADGADENNLHIIPNGVDIARYAKARRPEGAPVPQVIVLIGRVVPIKDIKTFIRTMQIVHASMPEVEGWLYGPEDEDEAYTRECRDLINSLGLAGVVKFKGFENPENIFPEVGLSVLSSVSEGQPLVILEGFAAGIPAVTTDVGSCRELICGISESDKALGESGEIVPIANPQALAVAAMRLLRSRQLWDEASRCAIARVEQYYSDTGMIQRYEKVYQHYRSSVESETACNELQLNNGRAA